MDIEEINKLTFPKKIVLVNGLLNTHRDKFYMSSYPFKYKSSKSPRWRRTTSNRQPSLGILQHLSASPMCA